VIIPVKKLLIVALRDKERILLRRLGELGVIHLKRLGEEDARKFVGTEVEKLRELEKLYYRFINLLGVLGEIGVEKEEKELYEKYVELRKKLDHLLAKHAELKQAMEAVKALMDLGEKEFPEIGEFPHIFSIIGTLPKSMVQTLKKDLENETVAIEVKEISEDEALIYLIGIIDVREKCRELFHTLPFKRITLPENFPRECDKALTALNDEISKLEEEIKIVKGELEELKKPLISFVKEGETGLSELKSLQSSFIQLQKELSVKPSAEKKESELDEKEIARILDETNKQYNLIKAKMEEIAEEKRKLGELRAVLESLSKTRDDLPEIGEFENIVSLVGIMNKDSFEVFQHFASKEGILFEENELEKGKIFLHVVCLKNRYRECVSRLNSLGFRELDSLKELPKSISDAQKVILEKLNKLESEKNELRQKFEELRSQFASKAGEIMSYLKISLKLGEALLSTLRSESMRVIQGWVSIDRLNYLKSELERLRRQFKGVLLYEIEDPKPGEKTPTSIKNPKPFNIFEPLIAQYGWPGPGETDPTIISGILWMLMFGVMFPDLGHGLTIIALGAFFAYVFKGKFLGINSKKFGKLMIGLGIFSTIFGLLVGEVFLVEVTPIFPGLRAGWIGQPGGVLWLIKVAIFFGAAQILLAMSMAFRNHLRNGETAEAIFGQHGLAGMLAFAGFLFTAFHFVGITIIPNVLRFPALGIGVLTQWPFFLMLGGIIMMTAKPFIAKEPISLSLGGILELMTAFMANTFSYTRIAGFAIVHAALAMVVHKLMEVNLLMGIGVGLIFLNGFALTIEFLVCMIQALRLLYYEFFTKFYEGSGIPYTPWKL